MKNQSDNFKGLFPTSINDELEKRILSFLKNNLKPNEIFERIKNNSDIDQISRFLYNFGLDKTLFDFSLKRLEESQSVSWPYILKLFIKYKITPNKNLEKLLFHHWLKNKENQSSALFACEEWGNISPEFQQFRFVYIRHMEEQNLSEERDLLEQLEFVQAQKLIREEEEIITKLLLINSENTQYKNLKKDLEEKKALLTIEEQKKIIDKADRLEDYISPFSFEDSPLKKDWFEKVFSVAEKQKSHTKNLALFLYFCEWPDKALNVLETHVSKMSEYWFYLDWILETKQYTKGLELINQLFLEKKESKTFFLPLVYIKSQILYAMGKKNLAIEILTAISQVQSDYKSTQYLLDKWLKNI